jgi:two-component system response regulator MprA
MNASKARSSVYTAQRDEANHGARILVVDDDPLLRLSLEAVLSRAGYSTASAGDGNEALTKLATDRFDLVITDGNMPRLDGCGLVRALRARGSQTPVMMISGMLAGGGRLPFDIRREVAVALAKPADSTDILAGVACSLRQPFSGAAETRSTSDSETIQRLKT